MTAYSSWDLGAWGPLRAPIYRREKQGRARYRIPETLTYRASLKMREAGSGAGFGKARERTQDLVRSGEAERSREGQLPYPHSDL